MEVEEENSHTFFGSVQSQLLDTKQRQTYPELSLPKIPSRGNWYGKVIAIDPEGGELCRFVDALEQGISQCFMKNKGVWVKEKVLGIPSIITEFDFPQRKGMDDASDLALASLCRYTCHDCSPPNGYSISQTDNGKFIPAAQRTPTAKHLVHALQHPQASLLLGEGSKVACIWRD